MTAQTLQQTQPKARNANIARIASIGLALSLLVAGALAYRSATSASDAGRVAHTSAGAETYNPIRHASSSAYDGGAYGSVQASVAAGLHTPIRSAGSSAYDGGAYGSVQASVAAGLHTPIRSASSSAYDGGAYGSVYSLASQHVRDVPALHSTGSAYDGQ